MSTPTTGRIPLARAERLAEHIAGLLEPACERIEIAGSIRRRKPEVGDLELLVVPMLVPGLDQMDLFGTPVQAGQTTNLLDARVAELLERGTFEHRLDVNGRKACGERFKRLSYQDVALDLFSVLPNTCVQCGTILPTRFSPGGARGGNQEDQQDLPQVRGAVHGATQELGVLQPGVRPTNSLRQGGTEGDQELPREVRGVRQGVPAQVLLQGRSDVRGEVRGGSSRAGDTAETPEVDGVSRRHDVEAGGRDGLGLRRGLPTGASERGEEGTHSGASPSGGEAHWAVPGAVGEGASPQRRQDGQSDRELGNRDPRAAQRRGHLPSLPKELPSPLACRKGGPCYASSWGVLYTIRTGPADFSHKLVTPRLHGGWMPAGMHVKDGALWDRGAIVETPTEEAFFAALGLPYLAPEQRTATVRLAPDRGRDWQWVDSAQRERVMA